MEGSFTEPQFAVLYRRAAVESIAYSWKETRSAEIDEKEQQGVLGGPPACCCAVCLIIFFCI